MTNIIEHPFAQYIRILGKGKTGSRSLNRQEAFDAFSMILNQQVEDVQLGAFLMLLRVKEESVDELIGFVQATRQYFQQSANYNAHSNLHIDLDWSSYAGKRKQYPWFILSALTLAKHGYKVFMHGSLGHTADRLYTEEVLNFLNIPLCQTLSEVETQLNTENFAYMPLQVISPKLQELILLKPILGLRSPINTLVRLMNPFNAQATLQSIFHPAYRASHQQAALGLGYLNNAVIKGEGGEFERNPDAKTLVCSIKNGEIHDYELPKLTKERSPIESHFDLNFFKQVWLGHQQHAYAELAIKETLAIALITMNTCSNYDDALSLAKQLWQNRHT